jgi:hypothetical protein
MPRKLLEIETLFDRALALGNLGSVQACQVHLQGSIRLHFRLNIYIFKPILFSLQTADPT